MSKLEIYMPDKIQEVLGSNFRYKVLEGGRGSAKSWAVADYCITKSFQLDGVILCTREFHRSISDSVHSLLEARIKTLKLESFFDIQRTTIVNLKTGCTFVYKGLSKNIESIKSIHNVQICWVEEAETVSKNSWIKLSPSVRAEGSEIIITFNPEEESNETYRRFILEPDKELVKSAHVTYHDNKYFPEVLRQEMESDKRADFELYEHIWLGKIKKFANALIFRDKYRVATEEEFEEVYQKIRDTIGEPRFFFGADWGTVDPTTLIRCFIYDRCLYIDYEAGGSYVELDEIAELFASVPLSKEWIIYADSSRPDTISHVKDKGFNISRCEKWKSKDGSIEDGITYLRSFDTIIVHPRCKQTAKEFGLYKYKTDKNTEEILPIIVDKNNHYIDALRYSLYLYIKNKVIDWKKNLTQDVEDFQTIEEIFVDRDFGDF